MKLKQVLIFIFLQMGFCLLHAQNYKEDMKKLYDVYLSKEHSVKQSFTIKYFDQERKNKLADTASGTVYITNGKMKYNISTSEILVNEQYYLLIDNESNFVYVTGNKKAGAVDYNRFLFDSSFATHNEKIVVVENNDTSVVYRINKPAVDIEYAEFRIRIPEYIYSEATIKYSKKMESVENDKPLVKITYSSVTLIENTSTENLYDESKIIYKGKKGLSLMPGYANYRLITDLETNNTNSNSK